MDARRFLPRRGCRVEKSRLRRNCRVRLVEEGPFLWFVSLTGFAVRFAVRPAKEMNPAAEGGRNALAVVTAKSKSKMDDQRCALLKSASCFRRNDSYENARHHLHSNTLRSYQGMNTTAPPTIMAAPP